MGPAMYVTPSVIVDGEVVTNDLVDINLSMRILLGSSYYEDWDRMARHSSRRIRWAIRSICGTPGTRPRFRSRKSATSKELHVGDVAALAR